MNVANAVLSAVSASLENAIQQHGDYPVNGILFCGRCNKPKEAFKTLLGMTVKVGVMCDCQLSEMEKREQKKRTDRISINRSIAFGSDRLAEELSKCTFANSNTPTDEGAMGKAKEYADHYDEYRQKGKGILFWGNVGCGKTFAALCIVNQLLDNGHTALFTSITRIANDMFALRSGRSEYLDDLLHYDIVVLDDLGAERDSEWMMEQVYAVIDTFSRARKPIVITTNLKKNEIMDESNQSKARIYSRVMGICDPVHFIGKDNRKTGWYRDVE